MNSGASVNAATLNMGISVAQLFQSYLHVGLGVSHDGKKQRKDIFSVGASVG